MLTNLGLVQNIFARVSWRDSRENAKQPVGDESGSSNKKEEPPERPATDNKQINDWVKAQADSHKSGEDRGAP
ncbi:MAG: hypothetical protein ABIG90_00315 [bacterium]